MQFVVPQFIDIEPKIIGPITPRQFILLIFAGGTTFICYKLLDFYVFVLTFLFLILPIFGSFIFVKINGRPFHYFVLNFLQTTKRPKLRIWKKEIIPEKEFVLKTEKKEASPPEIRKILPRGHLSDISILVDTGGLAREE